METPESPNAPGVPPPAEQPLSPATPPSEEDTWRSELRSRRPEPEIATYGALLALIAATFFIEGVTSGSDFTRALLTVLIAATMVLSLDVARARPVVKRAGTVLAVALVATVFVELITGGVDDGTAALADAVLVAIAPPAIFIGVVRRLTKTRAVTIESVLGVLCVYILLGMFFAFVYGSLDQLGSVPFFDQNVAASASRFQYYSFTTLATVGYGDFTARTNLGHTLSVAEALVGQVYLVTVVSLIVGNLGRRQR